MYPPIRQRATDPCAEPATVAAYAGGITVEAIKIKEAIAGFPDTDRRALSVWRNELDHYDWDKQMIWYFSRGGRGGALLERVRREIAGRSVPFAEGAAQQRRLEPGE